MRLRGSIFLWFVVALAGISAFGALMVVVHQPGFTQQDFAMTQQFHRDEGGWYETILLILGEFGRSILVFIMLELVVWLWLQRHPRELAALLLVVGGGFAVNYIARHVLAAPRIPLHAPFVLLRDTGFPSGHAMMATILYGLLLWAAFPRIAREQRAVAVLGTAGLVLLVGFTRLYFGEHYLSDVLGGFALGIGWLAGGIIALSWLGSRWPTSPHLT
ncbi:MAG TPA: phosphatase PAP2 family protein [Kouleothrix sp.]|nr:phosphatase PAP2 family protein [Kouleothrix sp.]